jgi:uncharacterized membrane protein
MERTLTAQRQRQLMLAFAALLSLPVLLGVPFVLKNTILWEEMNAPLLAGTVAYVLALLLHATVSFSPRTALRFFVLACSLGLAAEIAGLHWGWPFAAHYVYHPQLRPQFLGVPLFIPLSWFVLAYLPLVLLRGLPATGPLRNGRWLGKTLLCSLFLTGTDLLLDPLATSVGAWSWADPGGYLGIPMANFAGWFLVGCFIYGLFLAIEPDPGPPPLPAIDSTLVGLSAGVGLLALAAVAVHVGHWLPMVLPAAVLTPYFAHWYCHRSRGRPD